MHGGCDSPATMGTLVALAEAVLIVIAAQALGYMAKTFNFFPATAEVGMGAFVGKVAFPALLFHAIATIDLGTIKSAWALVVAVLLGKAVVWVLGYWLVGGAAIARPRILRGWAGHHHLSPLWASARGPRLARDAVARRAGAVCRGAVVAVGAVFGRRARRR